MTGMRVTDVDTGNQPLVFCESSLYSELLSISPDTEGIYFCVYDFFYMHVCTTNADLSLQPLTAALKLLTFFVF